jgi:hypothetical protein
VRCAVLVLLLLACGSAKKPAPASPVVAKKEPPPSAGPVSEDCRRAYDGYVKAWGDWFDAELDSDAQAALIAEFGQELPRRAALEEMRETADELRYEPGFELWIRALTATEDAIESCGEGAPRPR